jgi:hypothetical protein
MANTGALRGHLLQTSAGLFATLDGAQFDDLPGELAGKGLVYRPLYLDRGDRDRERAAIQLVPLGGQANSPERNAALAQLSDLVGDRPAAVFWQCPAGEEALYKHLRTINMVLIPKGTDVDDGEDVDDAPEAGAVADIVPAGTTPALAAGGTPFPPASNTDGGDEPQPENSEYELVLFRHADANVMAQVLPALDKAQFARLFGPATCIAFAPDEQWASNAGVLVAPRPEGLPPSAPGPLRLGEDVMDRIGDNRLAASRRNIEAYLRETAPEYTEKLSDLELKQLVFNAELTGEEIGFQTEYGHGLWAFLTLITDGTLLFNKDIRTHFATSDRLADEVVEEMIEEVSEADDETWEAWT